MRALQIGPISHEIGRLGTLRKYWDDVVALIAGLAVRGGAAYDADAVSTFLEAAVRSLSELLRVIIVRTGTRVVACTIFYHWNNQYFMHTTAHDPDAVEKTSFVRFNALYYLPLKMAIHEGVNRIDYGMDAYQEKVLRGCRIQIVEGLFKFPPEVAGRVKEVAALIDSVRRRTLDTYNAVHPFRSSADPAARIGL